MCAAYAACFDCRQLNFQGAGEPRDDRVLHFKHFPLIGVEFIRQKMSAGLDVDQLSVDPDARAALLRASSST